MHNISGAAINNGMNNDNKNDDNDKESNASGSTYSSIPDGLVLIIGLFETSNSEKHNRIQNWIDQSSENGRLKYRRLT